MTNAITFYPRAELLGLDVETLDDYVALDDEVLFSFTPALVRKLDFKVAARLARCLYSLARSKVEPMRLASPPRYSSTDNAQAWEGFTDPLPPGVFLKLLGDIANSHGDHGVDTVLPQESGHAEYLAAEVVRLAKARAARAEHLRASAADERLYESIAAQVAARPPAPAKAAVLTRAATSFSIEEADIIDVAARVVQTTAAPLPGQDVDNTEARELFLPALLAEQGDIKTFLPRSVMGGGLFGLAPRNATRARWGENAPRLITKISGYKEGSLTLSHSGEELRQGDAETWSKILSLSVHTPVGKDVHFRLSQLLALLRRPARGGNSRPTLRAEIVRLASARLHIRTNNARFIAEFAALFPSDLAAQDAKRTGVLEFSTHLLSPGVSSGATWSIQVPEKVRVLFAEKEFSWVDDSVYYALKGDTARSIYMLYASHANCFPLSLPELREFTGTRMAKNDQLKKAMDHAHNELVRVGYLTSWKYEVPKFRRLSAMAYCTVRPHAAALAAPGKTSARAIKAAHAAVDEMNEMNEAAYE